jgi:hypothetical protein
MAALACLTLPAAGQVSSRPEARPSAEAKPNPDAKPHPDAKPQPDASARDKPDPNPRPDANAKKDEVVTRVYDVRDLLLRIGDYPFAGTMAGSATPKPAAASTMGGGGGGGGGGGAPAEAAPAVAGPGGQSAADQIERLVLETIAPETWRDSGGSVGAVRMVNGMMVVTQTEANHKQLATLLAQLRETHARMVRVRAYWLLLQPGEVDALYKRPAGGAAGGAAGPATAYPEIDRDALEKVGGKAGHFRAETVCFNGQTVHVASGRARRVISSVTAVVGTSAAAYEPTADTVRGGLVLQVTPVLNPDHAAVTLDVQSTFADVDPPAAERAAGGAAAGARDAAGAGGAAGGAAGRGKGDGAGLPLAAEHSVGDGLAVDRYHAVSQELRTTINLPLGRPVLVGGMTLDPNAKGGDSPQLYLVVELTSWEQREG